MNNSYIAPDFKTLNTMIDIIIGIIIAYCVIGIVRLFWKAKKKKAKNA